VGTPTSAASTRCWCPHQQLKVFNLRESLKTQNFPSLLEKGRDEASKKAVFRDALNVFGRSGGLYTTIFLLWRRAKRIFVAIPNAKPF